MRFSVPTDFETVQPDLFDGLPVTEFRGVLQETPLGGAGRCEGGPLHHKVNREKAARHIRDVTKRGIAFNVLMEAPCLGGREYDIFEKEKMVDHIKWVADQGATIVTATSGFLIELINHHVPSLKVVVSENGFVDSVEKARFFLGFGADVVTVSSDANRDFVFLKALRTAVSGEIRLVVNRACIYPCPFSMFQALEGGHNMKSNASGEVDLLPMNRFEVEDLDVKEEIIKSRWIRPEDLDFYDTMGFSSFVVEGAGRSCTSILNTLRAYADKRWEGDLAALLYGACFDKITPSLSIDNRALDGFLQHFREFDCRIRCGECDFCKTNGARAVSDKGRTS